MEEKTINFDSQNWKHMIQLMDTYADSNTPFFGKNADGEDTEISIYSDRIALVTYQSNKWKRVNIYHREGWTEEIFDGKWEN